MVLLSALFVFSGDGLEAAIIFFLVVDFDGDELLSAAVPADNSNKQFFNLVILLNSLWYISIF